MKQIRLKNGIEIVKACSECGCPCCYDGLCCSIGGFHFTYTEINKNKNELIFKTCEYDDNCEFPKECPLEDYKGEE